MEVIQNIKNVLRNVKLNKDKNISKQYEEVQKVDDFTDNIKDLINRSLDLIEEKVVPKRTYFNNTQEKKPKAIQSSSSFGEVVHFVSNRSKNGEPTTISNEATFSIVQEASDEEEGIESSLIDFEGDDIESTPNRFAVVIDDHLDKEVLKKHSLPAFDFYEEDTIVYLRIINNNARDFKVICDDLTSKMKSISGKMGVVKKSKVLSDESKNEEIISLKFELSQVKKYKQRLLFMKDHFGIRDESIQGSGIFFYRDIKDLKDRLLLVLGEIEFGNDNPNVINEFVEIMGEMLKKGEIDLKTLNKVYNELNII